MKKFSSSFFDIKYLPILILYFVLIYFFGADELISDKLRYWKFSGNLLQGHYFDNEDSLWAGPGYPIYIFLYRLMGIGWEFIVSVNGVLLYLSVLIFKEIMVKQGIKNIIFYTYLFAFWEPVLLYQYLPHLMTEIFTIFLMSIFGYYVLSNHKQKLIISGLFFSFIILTKVIFAYVAPVLILFTLLNKKLRGEKFFLIPIYAIMFCIPYLIYTYNLSDKFYYFANSGGSSLYWMSAPQDSFRGDWNGGYGYSQNTPNLAKEEYNSFLKKETLHLKDIQSMGWLEQDEKLKELAIKNILLNKTKFFKNWINNLGRLFFGYPFSFHTPNWQHILITFKQSFFIVLLSLSYLITFLNHKKIRTEFLFLFLFMSIYLSGISLLSSYPRFLFITNILSWSYMAYVFKNFLVLKLIKK